MTALPRNPVANNASGRAGSPRARIKTDVVAAAAQNKYYGTIWRTSLGIGCVFPLILLVMRLKLKEPEEFSKNSMKHTRTPYLLVLRCYGWRLLAVSLIWFIYDVRTPPPAVVVCNNTNYPWPP